LIPEARQARVMIVVTSEMTHRCRRLAFPAVRGSSRCRPGCIGIDLDDLFETGLKCGHQCFAATVVNVLEHGPSCGDDPAVLLYE